ncbi:competence type IV pilus major pilin ComGC [Halalkalibacter urbisdiaboli]|uniref:competence type IV pilus major pilin ComGC n=1 Tax=Halalkalibacter urbisdiaboli TaxID=1960589 RepID=UPI003CC970AF
MKYSIFEEKGFTLIEMLVVLMIISILLLIAIPNMTKNNQVASEKGCDATIKLLQTQVHAYEIEKGSPPQQLTDLSGYVEQTDCPGNEELDLIDGEIVRKTSSR